MPPEQCKWCLHWSWSRDTCGTSLNCLNLVIQGEAPTRYVNILEVLFKEDK